MPALLPRHSSKMPTFSEATSSEEIKTLCKTLTWWDRMLTCWDRILTWWDRMVLTLSRKTWESLKLTARLRAHQDWCKDHPTDNLFRDPPQVSIKDHPSSRLASTNPLDNSLVIQPAPPQEATQSITLKCIRVKTKWCKDKTSELPTKTSATKVSSLERLWSKRSMKHPSWFPITNRLSSNPSTKVKKCYVLKSALSPNKSRMHPSLRKSIRTSFTSITKTSLLNTRKTSSMNIIRMLSINTTNPLFMKSTFMSTISPSSTRSTLL